MTARAHSAGLASSRLLQSSGCDDIQDFLNLSATAEAFAVTALGGAIDNALNGLLPISEEAVGALQAARAAEEAHYQFFLDEGAEPVTLTFTIPDETILTDPATFWPTLIALEEAFIAHYCAAAQQMVAQGEDRLARVALQIGAVEAEHRVGARFYAIAEAGVLDGVPNDVAFEQALFTSVTEAAALLEELGFIGGEGIEVEYPGPGEIDLELVENREP